MRPLSTLLVIAAMTVVITSTSRAQAYLNAGFTAGINLASVSVDPHFSDFAPGTTDGIRIGPMFGGTLEWGVRDFIIAFQPEVQYLEKGTVVDVPPGQTSQTSRNIRFTYVEIPVLARVKLMEGVTRGYLIVGPNFGFNLDATGTLTFADTTSEVDYFEGVKRTDIGIDIGGGLEFELSPGMRLLGDVRYTHGLTDVTQPVDVRPEEETWYSRDIKIKVGLKWDLWQASH